MVAFFSEKSLVKEVFVTSKGVKGSCVTEGLIRYSQLHDKKWNQLVVVAAERSS